MAHQRTIWMAFSLMIIMTIAITPAQGEANWLETINTSLQDLRKSVAKSLEDLSMKFAFTGGKPSPRDTSKILEVLGALQRTMAEQSGRKITVRVNSEGYDQRKREKGHAPLHGDPTFYVNERPVTTNVRGRGFNILTISRQNGTVLEARKFDTYGSESQGNAMWEFVKNVPDDTIVLVSVLDEASNKCKAKCYDAIREVGGTLTNETFGIRVGYALIGYKGSACGSRPPWMKEMTRERLRADDRDGYGSLPISLISEIDLDDCYRE